MKTAYIVTIAILWVLIILQIPSMVKSARLLKKEQKLLDDMEKLNKEIEDARDGYLKAKADYEAAKDRCMSKILDETTEDNCEDAPPQNGPEFVYSHKNGEIYMEAARCDIEWLATEITYQAHRLYNGLMKEEPDAAALFRDVITFAISSENSPTWNVDPTEVNGMLIMTTKGGEEQEESDQ